MTTPLDTVYRERAHLLAHLSALYPSHIQPDMSEPDWPVLYISFPTGQCCWHLNDSDLDLFGHVPVDVYEIWDGHTTDEKYERVDKATQAKAAARAQRSNDLSARNPAVRQIHRFFAYDHLPAHLQMVSQHFAITADLLLRWLPDSPELTVCLRKLLEAKDCAVRAAVDSNAT